MDATNIVKPGSPKFWGPFLWRLYHLCAEFPTTTESIKLWKHILRTTARIMPCETCREHLLQYLDTHPVKEDIRTYLWSLHNHVNKRNDLPEFPYQELSVYKQISEKSDRLLEIQQLFAILQDTWNPLSHITTYSNIYNEWKKYIVMLLRII